MPSQDEAPLDTALTAVVVERLQREIADLENRLAVAQEDNHALRNALMWIRLQAGLHYMGQAFDPEHMRGLANLAADALLPTWDAQARLPDYEKTMRRAQRRGVKLAEKMARLVAATEAEEDSAPASPGADQGDEPESRPAL